MADDDKKGRLLLTNRIMKPVERRAIANLQKQVGKIDRLINLEIDSFSDFRALNRYGDLDEKKANWQKKISALEKQIDQKKAAIKDVKDGALSKGKASPASKTVMGAVNKSRDRSLLGSGDKPLRSGGGARGGMMVAINRWKDLFS